MRTKDPAVNAALDAIQFRITAKDLPLRVERDDRRKFQIGRIFTKDGRQVLSLIGVDFAQKVVDAVHELAPRQ